LRDVQRSIVRLFIARQGRPIAEVHVVDLRDPDFNPRISTPVIVCQGRKTIVRPVRDNAPWRVATA
jgi:hypothetical protein